MKVLALDLGDVWTGTALSDPLGMLAKPYKTIQTSELERFLSDLFSQTSIYTIVVGNPKTFRGTDSEQTKKIHTLKESLEKVFFNKEWILWDERLTSKSAQSIMRTNTTTEKQRVHSIAAALILESYLQHAALAKKRDEQNE